MGSVEFVHVTKRFGAVTAVDDLSLRVENGEFLVLVGPSGCGKTTALRMVAGLEDATAGSIRIDEQDVTYASPKQRDVGMVFQTYALYPQMTVFDNLAFGLRQRRVPGDEVRRRVADVAAMLGLEVLLKRRPRELSGGQRQRVALGRAIARRPRVFLMDEPLSNLDAQLRTQTRSEILRLHRELPVTTLYVTHDQVEAMTMGARIAVMNAGVLQQVDTPQRVYDRPANVFVAQFIGNPPMNLLTGEIIDGRFRADTVDLALNAPPLAMDGRVVLGIRPEHLSPSAQASDDTLEGVVGLIEPLGSDQLVTVSIGSAHVTARLSPQDNVQLGQRLRLRVDVRRVSLFDAESGERIEGSERPALVSVPAGSGGGP